MIEKPLTATECRASVKAALDNPPPTYVAMQRRIQEEILNPVLDMIIEKLDYQKVEGLRAEGISAHINEALKEMDE